MLVFYAVSTILTVGLGICSNWYDRPRGLNNRRLSGIIAAMVVMMVGVTLWHDSSDEKPAAAGAVARPPVTTSAPQSNGHSLTAWVADVNRVCVPVTADLEEVKARYGHTDASEFTEAEGVEYMHTVSKVIGPLLRDLNQLELPTGQQGRVKANGWLQAYRTWYTAYVAVLGNLDESMDASLFEQIMSYPGDRGAATKFTDARADLTGRGAALGIECPFSDVTK